MGKKGRWISALKKAINCESKDKKREKRSHRRGCFGKQNSIKNLDSSKLMEAENEQNRHAYSVAIVTAMAAEAAVAAAQAAAEVVRLRAAAAFTSKEDTAAIKIQTAFRGYLARRVLKALRSIIRLKSFIGGQSGKRQAAAMLKCLQTMSRLQSEVSGRRIRMLEDNSAICHQKYNMLPDPIGEKWDDSTHSKEQIEANLQNRQEAASRRERALAYAHSHQQKWRSTSSSTNATLLVDPNDAGSGWSWLERWMANRSWDDAIVSAKTPNIRKQSQSPKSNSSQSGVGRRYSIADDDSLTSSCTSVPNYMASTESARAKSRLSSKIGTPENLSPGVSVKKRLSFSSSSSSQKRHSVPK